MQRHDKRVAGTAFQVWTLAVRPDQTATLTCEGGGHIILTREISSTDFPLDEITPYCTNGVIYLPSEH